MIDFALDGSLYSMRSSKTVKLNATSQVFAVRKNHSGCNKRQMVDCKIPTSPYLRCSLPYSYKQFPLQIRRKRGRVISPGGDHW